MDEARTEEATPKRLEEARRAGDVPTSRDATFAAALVGALLALVLTAGAGFAAVSMFARAAWGGGAEPLDLLRQGGWSVLRVAGPVLLAALVAAVLVGVAQTRGLFAPRALSGRLRWSLGTRPWSAVRSILVVTGVTSMVAILARPWVRSVAVLPRADSGRTLESIGAMVLGLCVALACVALIVGGLDVLVNRWMWRRRMRMTRWEIQRERRESHGDPWVSEERRRLHRDSAGE